MMTLHKKVNVRPVMLDQGPKRHSLTLKCHHRLASYVEAHFMQRNDHTLNTKPIAAYLALPI